LNTACPGPYANLDKIFGVFSCGGLWGKYLFIQNVASNNFPLGYCEVEAYTTVDGP